MHIQRDSYIKKLISHKNNGMIKVITGIRRCGKSYLLFNLFYNHLLLNGISTDHIITIALDDRANKGLRDPDALDAYIRHSIKDNDTYYILLDEVQYVREFEDVLNGFLHIKNVDVYVTGSNAKFLSKDIITEFRGRGDQIHMQPLSFKEFFSVNTSSVEDAWKDYLLYGGLPKILEFKTHEDKIQYLTNIFAETYLVDILDRNQVNNEPELEEILDILSSSIGSLTNPQKISDTFKSVKNISIHSSTIKRYLDLLTDSFLISQSKRFDIKGRRYISTPSKYYFSDIGLRNARLNFRQVEETHIMENIIYNELIHRGYSVDIGVVSINDKNETGTYSMKQHEVDFVCNLGDKRYYIQSALTLPSRQKVLQEEKSLLNIGDCFKKIIITKDAIKNGYNEDGVLIINLFDFLLNEDIFGI